MIDKRIGSPAEAVSEIFDGATVMIGGFGEAGSPIELIHALIDRGTKETYAPGSTFKTVVAAAGVDTGTAGPSAVFDDPLEVRRTIGYLPQRAPLYTDMGVREYLRFVSEFVGVPIKVVGVGPAREQVIWIGAEPGAMGCPRCQARRSAASMGPYSRRMSTLSPTKTSVKKQ